MGWFVIFLSLACVSLVLGIVCTAHVLTTQTSTRLVESETVTGQAAVDRMHGLEDGRSGGVGPTGASGRAFVGTGIHTRATAGLSWDELLQAYRTRTLRNHLGMLVGVAGWLGTFFFGGFAFIAHGEGVVFGSLWVGIVVYGVVRYGIGGLRAAARRADEAAAVQPPPPTSEGGA